MGSTIHSGSRLYAPVVVQPVVASRPLTWVQKGWEDLRQMRGASLAHGALVSGLGLVLVAVGNSNRYFLAAALSGFLLVGPIMSAGLCELSRRRAAGEPASFDDSLKGLVLNHSALLEFGAHLMALGLIWFVLSDVILRLAFGGAAGEGGASLWGGIFDGLAPSQMLAYLGIGGLLACLAFALSVISAPMILDRGVSAREAMRASLRAARVDLPAMLVWSGLIVLFTAIGFLTFPFGMVVVVPLLGHATWHAYEDLVR